MCFHYSFSFAEDVYTSVESSFPFSCFSSEGIGDDCSKTGSPDIPRDRSIRQWYMFWNSKLSENLKSIDTNSNCWSLSGKKNKVLPNVAKTWECFGKDLKLVIGLTYSIKNRISYRLLLKSCIPRCNACCCDIINEKVA